MRSFAVFMFVLFLTLISKSVCGTVKIKLNTMPEHMANLAVGEAMMAIEKSLSNVEIAAKLTKAFSEEFGSYWICFVGSDASVSHFDASPNSEILFTIENIQIVLFKPLERTESSYITDAKKLISSVTVVKSEMSDQMREHAITISSISLKNYNDFKSISANISSSMTALYGYHWVCSLSSNFNEIKAEYIEKSFLSFTIADIKFSIFQTSVPDIKLNFLDLMRESLNEKESLITRRGEISDSNSKMIFDLVKEETQHTLNTTGENECQKNESQVTESACFSNFAGNIQDSLNKKFNYTCDVTVAVFKYYAFRPSEAKTVLNYNLGRLNFYFNFHKNSIQ